MFSQVKNFFKAAQGEVDSSVDDPGAGGESESLDVSTTGAEGGQEKTEKGAANPFAVQHDVEFIHETDEDKIEADPEAFEAELHNHFKDCPKNPGHPGFIPVNEFTIQHLPDAYRCHEMLQMVMVWAQMTVRIRVSYTSESRPKVFPDGHDAQTYPYYQPGGSFPYKAWAKKRKSRVGSGYVLLVDRGGKWRQSQFDEMYGNVEEEEIFSDESGNRDQDGAEGVGQRNENEGEDNQEADDEDEWTDIDDDETDESDELSIDAELKGPCPCSENCTAENWARLTLFTAVHLIYDQEEVDHTEFEFFFACDKDRADGHTRKIQGGKLWSASVNGDRCEIWCYTHDELLITRLELARACWKNIRGSLCFMSTGGILPAVMVSHPHGCAKVVTIGEVIEQKGDEYIYPVSMYSTPSCPGSSGAPVLWWLKNPRTGQPDFRVDPSSHSGFCTVGGRKLGRCTQW